MSSKNKSNGMIAQIRRNITLIKYPKYHEDKI